MDIIPMKWAEIVALNEHTSMTVRDFAFVVGARKSSVSRILCAYNDSGSFSANLGKMRKKTKSYSTY
jgi:hypothetical protein